MLRILPFLLATIVLLAGCRETLSGPEAPLSDPVVDPSPPAATVGPLYVKGLAELRVGQSGNYRAEPFTHPELDHFEWRSYGVGQFSFEVDDPSSLGRLVRARSTRNGTTLLAAHAFAQDGRLLAYGEKVVEIR